MPIKKVFLIRHGETDYNREGRFQGTLQIPLNQTGHNQAQALGQYLQNQSIDAVYASHLSRAYETAEYIAKVADLSVRQDSRLAEINLGKFQGLHHNTMAEAHPNEYRMYKSGDMSYSPPDGESRRSVQERITTAWLEITAQTDYDTVAIVSHGAALKILLRHMFYRIDDIRLPNTAITTLVRFHDVWEIQSFAETPHLND